MAQMTSDVNMNKTDITHNWGYRGRSPLPEREVSSHVSLPHSGPPARQKKYA